MIAVKPKATLPGVSARRRLSDLLQHPFPAGLAARVLEVDQVMGPLFDLEWARMEFRQGSVTIQLLKAGFLHTLNSQ